MVTLCDTTQAKWHNQCLTCSCQTEPGIWQELNTDISPCCWHNWMYVCVSVCVSLCLTSIGHGALWVCGEILSQLLSLLLRDVQPKEGQGLETETQHVWIYMMGEFNAECLCFTSADPKKTRNMYNKNEVAGTSVSHSAALSLPLSHCHSYSGVSVAQHNPESHPNVKFLSQLSCFCDDTLRMERLNVTHWCFACKLRHTQGQEINIYLVLPIWSLILRQNCDNQKAKFQANVNVDDSSPHAHTHIYSKYRGGSYPQHTYICFVMFVIFVSYLDELLLNCSKKSGAPFLKNIFLF